MKNLIKSAALLLCAIVFISCNKDDELITGPGGGTTSNINGGVQNWPGQILFAQAIASGSGLAVVGTDTILADGNLNMDLTIPPPSILRSIADLTNDTGVVISDSTAFYAAFGNLLVTDLSNNSVGMIERKNFDSTAVVGSFIVSFIYVDRPTSITGASMTVTGLDTNRTEFNLSLEQGWNVFYLQQTVDNPNFTGLLVASGEPAGATWRYTASPVANRLHRLFKF